jgi:hypothetical protein
MRFLVLNLNRPQLGILFRLGIAETLINQCENTDDDKNNTCNFPLFLIKLLLI